MTSRKIAIFYLIIYFIINSSSFVSFHFLIDNLEPTYRALNGLAILYSLLAYLIYLLTTPFFYVKIVSINFFKGVLFMFLSMIIAGFFIWLAFGHGRYSPEFYPYEFVSAGLWFGFCNAGIMCFIRFWKSFKERHKRESS